MSIFKKVVGVFRPERPTADALPTQSEAQSSTANAAEAEAADRVVAVAIRWLTVHGPVW